jgi:hypothetical protein
MRIVVAACDCISHCAILVAVSHSRAAGFAAIAHREGKGERHIRLLAPLAFVSPRIVAAILDGTAPAGLTITTLARAALVLGRAGDWV